MAHTHTKHIASLQNDATSKQVILLFKGFISYCNFCPFPMLYQCNSLFKENKKLTNTNKINPILKKNLNLTYVLKIKSQKSYSGRSKMVGHLLRNDSLTRIVVYGCI